MSGLIHTGDAVYLNGDKTAIVDLSSPDASFLLVGPDSEVPREFEALYREHFGVEANAHVEKPRTVTYGSLDDDETAVEAEPTDEPTEEPAPKPAAAKKPRKRTAKK